MTYYDLLEVKNNASDEVIRMAYKALAKKYHPDTTMENKEEAEVIMKQINEAYEVLTDQDKRRRYDEYLFGKSNENEEINKEKMNEEESNNSQDNNANYGNDNIYNKMEDNRKVKLLPTMILSTIIWIISIGFDSIIGVIISLILIINKYGKLRGYRFRRFIAGTYIVFIGLMLWTMLSSPTNNANDIEDVKEVAGSNINDSTKEEPVNNDNESSQSIDDVIISNEEDNTEEGMNTVGVETAINDEKLRDSQLVNELLITDPKFITAYANLNKIKLYDNLILNAEKADEPGIKKLFELSIDPSNAVFIKEDSEFLKGSSYNLTLENSNIAYFGDMKDNKPHGYGMVGRLISYPDLVTIEYIGEFKDGKYSGEGSLFYVPNEDDIDRMYRIYGENEYIEHINSELVHLIYEGEFKNGKFDGKGNYYNYPDNLYFYYYSGPGMFLDAQEYPRYIDYLKTIKDLDIIVGEFSKGDLSNGKLYSNGYLLYDGEFAEFQYHGKGKLYFQKSTQLQYNGEFSRGYFDGKGTLYDESGNKLYSGEWKDGDYK
ncbi:MAG: DnaJ domain-containing protein [Vulcanibacillus sp.]